MDLRYHCFVYSQCICSIQHGILDMGVLNKRILSFCQLPSYLWFHFFSFLTRPTVKYLPVILYCLASADGRDTAV